MFHVGNFFIGHGFAGADVDLTAFKIVDFHGHVADDVIILGGGEELDIFGVGLTGELGFDPGFAGADLGEDGVHHFRNMSGED